MPVRLIIIAVVVLAVAVGGLAWYGYSLAPAQKSVTVQVPNDQFPQ
jgi:hypothetical protein